MPRRLLGIPPRKFISDPGYSKAGSNEDNFFEICGSLSLGSCGIQCRRYQLDVMTRIEEAKQLTGSFERWLGL
ncbi:hypothetical protein PM082_022773 [Marasmius tenuissimus]|nr:hypothetical protein PM082_022773 [Marasmius tenuissimus]